jgi:hypothetical protein
MRRLVSAGLFVLLVFATCLASAGDLNGRWEGKVKGPNGDDVQIAFTFKVDGEKLTGTVETPMGELPITDGKVKGDEISFKVDLGDNAITHQAKLSGKTLNMKAQAPWGDREFPLKRAAEKKK